MYRACMKVSSWWAVSHIGCRLSTERLITTAATSSVRDFARRHIGPNAAHTSAMLEYLQLQVILLLFRLVCFA